MNGTSPLQLAEQLLSGKISPAEFAQFVSQAQGIRLDTHATTVDIDRQRRCGFPEVIFAEGKSSQALRAIVAAHLERGEEAFATRVSPEKAHDLQQDYPLANYNSVARTWRAHPADKRLGTDLIGHVAVITAGTSDLAVAEEARETLDWMGIRTTIVHDVGVAGPHRLPARLAEFSDADVVVVVAGMEGALPSVVGGYVPCPVIAVPTSVGYGASLGGIASLLGMLNSCAANVAVVNIDAGFKAGYLAGLIASRQHKEKE